MAKQKLNQNLNVDKRLHDNCSFLGTEGEGEADASDPAKESGTNSPTELADGVEEMKLTDGQSPNSDPGVDMALQQEEEAAQVSGRSNGILIFRICMPV